MCTKEVSRPQVCQPIGHRIVPRKKKSASLRIHGFVLLSLLLFGLCGCGEVALTTTNTVIATPATIAFGNVAVGQTATARVTLQNRGVSTVEIEDLGASGQAFSVAGGTTFPISLAVGSSVTVRLQFTPTNSGSMTEPLMITSSLAADPKAIASISGTGTPGLSSFTCSSNSLAGAGTDSCSVTLNAAALTGGFVVSLTSNDAAVALPSTVTVPASATSATFTATATAVSAVQSALLTATGSGTSESFSISLAPNSGGPREVELTWDPPSSQSDPITGYNIYRSANGSTFQLLNSGIDPATTYTDNAVQSGSVYNYYVESIDAAGDSSAPSNSATVAIP